MNVVPRPSSLCDVDRAAVQLDQLLHQRETDARAFVRAAARAFDAVKALEDARQLVAAGCRCRCRCTVQHRRGGDALQTDADLAPRSVNLNAFETRLRTIFSHMSRST